MVLVSLDTLITSLDPRSAIRKYLKKNKLFFNKYEGLGCIKMRHFRDFQTMEVQNCNYLRHAQILDSKCCHFGNELIVPKADFSMYV